MKTISQKILETEILNDIFQTVYENNKRIYNDNEIELYTGDIYLMIELIVNMNGQIMKAIK